MTKHCSTCAFSYMQAENNHLAKRNLQKTQHCSNKSYNSPAYTSQMMLEDWGRGYCRFWKPKGEKEH